MRRNKAERARDLARETAKGSGYPVEGVKRYTDTDFPATTPTCWAVVLNESNGVVVYEDDPRTVVSVGNRAGRFVKVESAL